jgi:hypothetical protein
MFVSYSISMLRLDAFKVNNTIPDQKSEDIAFLNLLI